VPSLLPRASGPWVANAISEAKAAYDGGRFNDAARAYAGLVKTSTTGLQSGIAGFR
jgi:hypothetical protein